MISNDLLKIKILDNIYNSIDSKFCIKLKEICETISKGTTPRGGNDTYIDYGVRFLRAENIVHCVVNNSNLKYVSEEVNSGFLKRSILEENDILVTIAGTLGRCAVVTKEDLPANCNQAISFIRIDKSVEFDSRFICYMISSSIVQNKLLGQIKKTAQPNLTLEHIKNIEIKLPSLEEQQRIVTKIGELFNLVDRKARNDQEKNQLKAILKDKILNRAIHGELVEQDDNDTPAHITLSAIKRIQLDLFNSKKIKKDTKVSYDKPNIILPDNWEWVRLGDLGIYKKGPFGSSLTKDMFVDDSNSSIKVYEQKNAIQKDWRIGSYFITEDKYKSMLSFTVKPKDIIVSCAGTIGEIYVLPDDARIGIINQALMKITLFDETYKDYYLMYFDYVLKVESREKSKGTAISNIPPFDVLKNIYIPFPPIEEQQRIVSKIKECFDLIDTL